MAPHRNQQHGCVWCVSAIKWLPVLFIIAVVVWSYYAYIIQLCLFTITNIFQKIIYIILYHCFLAMFFWSYWQTIFAHSGYVPKQFHLPPAEVDKLEKEENIENQRLILERFAANLPVSCRTMTGAIRYCEKCCYVKPDRAHHCSVCGECVLKMDHHCPWVNNCVAFTNYKFFVLFLGYAFLYCVYIALTTVQFFVQFWKNELQGMGKFHILFVFCVAIMFGISLISLFGYHLYLVAKNRSTLEAFRPPIFRSGPDKDGFSLGTFANFIEVFGEERRLWFLPITTSLGDGLSFPTRIQQPANNYESTGTTQPSMGDGVSFPQRMVDDDTDELLGTRQRWSEEDETQHATLHAPYQGDGSTDVTIVVQ